MKKTVLISLCLIFSFAIFGQQSKTLQNINKEVEKIDAASWNVEGYDTYKSKIERLEKQCKTFDCGEVPILLMLYRAEVAVNEGKSEIIYQELLPTLQNRKIEDPIIKGFGHELAGLFYILNAKNDSCLIHLKIAEATLEKENSTDKRFGRVNEYLGFYYSFQNIHDTSLIYMKKAIDIHFQNQDTLPAIKASRYLSTFYNVMGETEQSIKTLLKTKKWVENFPPAKDFTNRIDAGLANAYMSLEDYEKVEDIAQKAINRIENKGDVKANRIDLWDFYLLLADVKIKTNEIEAAAEAVEKAKAICEQYDLASIHTINTVFYEAEIELLLGNYGKSEQILVQLNKDFKSEELASYQLKTADLLFKLVANEHQFQSNLLQQFKPRIVEMAAKTTAYNQDAFRIFRLKTVYDILDKNTKSALTNFNRVLAINDTIQIDKHNTELNELLIRQENLEQEKKLALNEVKLKDRTIQRNALIAGFLLILLIVGGLLWRSREKQRLNQLLEKRIVERTEELRLANEQLLQSNKELERFNYIISHDLKEPLRNILGYISLIDHRKMVQNEELQTFFKHISNNGQQMNLLLQNTMQYVNIRNKPVELSTVDISLLLSEILQEEAIIINANNATITFDQTPSIQTDKEAIYLVFKNLIDNALKFNHNENPVVSISYNDTPKFHEFLVKDNGIGIETDYHEQVFVLFKRLHHRGKYQGAGVGLSMCKQIIENLNGKIKIENSDENGTTFKLQLPKD